MRLIFYSFSLILVMSLAYLANLESVKTKATMYSAKLLRTEVDELKEELKFLNAEWALLNRPDRLTDLVKWHYRELKLIPISIKNFKSIKSVELSKPSNRKE
tara:strand:+ start:639 stop:944 length:306 start_codon:yes stop_codon:yes gene_type:complete